jgi:hypothetical protein
VESTEETVETVCGGWIVRRAMRLFDGLRDAGTERDTAGNRRFLFSHYAGLHLLGLLNPSLGSLRALQRASESEHVQKMLGGGRVSRGSLSESVRVFDPALLEPLVRQLAAELPAGHPGPGPHRSVPDTIPEELARRLVAVDGSVLRVLPQIVSAAMRSGGEAWRLHLQFRILDGTPGELVVTPDGIGGETDERRVLERTLEADRVYVCDRGYEKHDLFRAIVGAGSDDVVRGQDRSVGVLESRPLTAEDVAARVVSDDLVAVGPGGRGLGHAVRRVVVEGRERGRLRSDREPSERIVLWTNLVDVPAAVLATIYEQRWTIELFFRFPEHVLGCKRLFSDKPEGVAIQVYVIACLLLAATTGGNVGAVEMELIQMHLQGWSTEEELHAALARHPASKARARARYAARR